MNDFRSANVEVVFVQLADSSETEWGSGHYFRTLAAVGSLFCNRDVHPANSRPDDSAAECRSCAG
jgi:hypothetical protein